MPKIQLAIQVFSSASFGSSKWEVSKFSVSSRKSILTFLGQNTSCKCSGSSSTLYICIDGTEMPPLSTSGAVWEEFCGLCSNLREGKKRKKPRISFGTEIPVGSAVVSRQPNLSSEEDAQAVAPAPSGFCQEQPQGHEEKQGCGKEAVWPNCDPENAERRREKPPQRELLFVLARFKLNSWQLPEPGSTRHPEPHSATTQDKAMPQRRHRKRIAHGFIQRRKAARKAELSKSPACIIPPNTGALCSSSGAKALSERLLNNIYRAGDNSVGKHLKISSGLAP